MRRRAYCCLNYLGCGSTRYDEENWYERFLERSKLRLWERKPESLYRLLPPSPGPLRILFLQNYG